MNLNSCVNYAHFRKSGHKYQISCAIQLCIKYQLSCAIQLYIKYQISCAIQLYLKHRLHASHADAVHIAFHIVAIAVELPHILKINLINY